MVPGHFLAMLTMVRSSLLFSAILCSCLNFGFPPQCPHIEERLSHFFATLAQDGLAECGQPGKNPLKYSTTAGN